LWQRKLGVFLVLLLFSNIILIAARGARKWLARVFDLDAAEVIRGLYFFGFLFIALSLVAIVGVAIAIVYKAIKSVPVDGDGNLRAADLPPIADWINALAAAPKWIALIFIGIGFLVFGVLLDGYHWKDGGFISPTPTVAASGSPTATMTSTETSLGGE
jgi:hypothetical protein